MSQKSIAKIIQELAAVSPDRPAITHESESITRRNLHKTTNRLARAYQQLGVAPGDFVTCLLYTSDAADE